MLLRRRSTSLVLFGWWLCVTGVARAQEVARIPAVRLDFQGCEQGEVDEIRRLVPIDLGATSEADRLQHREVSILCRDRNVELRLIRSPAQGLFRSLDFSETEASARPRLVAIVVVELLAAGESDGEMTKPPRRPEASPASGEARPMPLQYDSRLQVEAIGSGRTLLGGVPRLLGGGVRIAANGRVPWSGNVLFERSSTTTTEGSVRIDSLTAGLALSLVAPLGPATARGGAGLRGGVTHLVGRASDPTEVQSDSLLRGWGGPMIEGSLTFALRRSVAFEFVAESGYVVFPIYGLVTGQREVALSGLWIGAQIGIGISSD